MITEMTAYYRSLGMTLSDALENLYREYGLYREGVLDLYMEGLDGIERRRRIMASLRESMPESFGGVPVALFTDHAKRVTVSLKDGKQSDTGMTESDVLYYTLENGDKVVVRPSGTEPKIKFYFLAHGEDKDTLEAKLAAYTADAKALAEA